MSRRICTTSSGSVAMSEVSTPGGPVWRVRGIPVGNTRGRRFLRATPPDPWTGIRYDDPMPSVSPQHENAFQFDRPGRVVGSEIDCVHASVWVPAGATDLPVLVWVHGGGGFAGSSTARDGSILAASLGAVVVTLSFRVGALGHLHVENLLGPGFADAGNVAIHDLHAGLEWVHREVASFGGDPGRITLAGQSAGAATVASIIASESWNSRVSRAIMQSGTAERVHTADEASAVAAVVAEALGGADRLLECPVEDLLAAQAHLLRGLLGTAAELPTPFRPVRDTREPMRHQREPRAMAGGSHIPLLIGTNLRECTPSAALFPEAPARLLRAGDAYTAALADVRRSGWDVGSDLEAWCTDHSYRQPTERVLETRSAADAPVYAYLFEGDDQHPPFHNSELDLLFGAESAPVGIPSLWRSFVTGDFSSPLGGLWEPHHLGHQVAVLGSDPRLMSDPLGPLREAWNLTG